MNWKRNGPTAIECGQWRISKAYLDGCTIYAGHYANGDAFMFSEDVEDIKEEIEKHQKNNEQSK